jgi:hypothetical protein
MLKQAKADFSPDLHLIQPIYIEYHFHLIVHQNHLAYLRVSSSCGSSLDSKDWSLRRLTDASKNVLLQLRSNGLKHRGIKQPVILGCPVINIKKVLHYFISQLPDLNFLTCLSESNGGSALSFSQRRRSDSGHDDVLAGGTTRKAVQNAE